MSFLTHTNKQAAVEIKFGVTLLRQRIGEVGVWLTGTDH